MDDNSHHILTYIEEIARRTAEGEEPEVISRVTNLDITTVYKCMSDPRFDEVLQSLSPEAFKEFKQARAADQSGMRVKTKAKENALRNYDALQELVDSKVLDPKDEAAYRLKLLQVSGAVEKEVEERVIKLAPAQMSTLKETFEHIN
jgi:hypothetical protein